MAPEPGLARAFSVWVTHEWRRTMGTRTIALAALLVVDTGLVPRAQAADTTGCTPREQSNQTLSQQLIRHVICPPDIDPDMKVPTPKAGNTPVIPPPESRGGSPNVQPK